MIKHRWTVVMIFLSSFGFSLEMVNSVYQSYFDYLSLTGKAEVPSLMYHSLSSNNWNIDNNRLWDNGLSAGENLFPFSGLGLKLVSPRIIISGNTAYSRKELSDGAWWQGRGGNTFLTLGIRLETEFLNISIIPEFWTAQNLPFPIIPSGTVSDYGYYSSSIDYPQIMGSDPIYKLGWGQSDIRLNWNNWTLGVSNENIKWGPSKINSLMISDNASGFPHIDFGLRKTGTSLGNFEFRAIRGQLTESDFYDENSDNDKTFISGITTGFSPVFIPGLTLGLKWSLMANWEDFVKSWQLIVFGYDFSNTYFGGDRLDQKGSFTIDWLFPSVGFEWYFEFFKEDYSPSLRYILLAPGHAAGYTVGGEKSFKLGEKDGFRAIVEWNQLIQSRDYEIDLGAGGIYYTHGIVNHGFTNLGQMLGAGIGPGSDAETLLIDYYDTWGKAGIMLRRICWDKMYLYRDPDTKSSPDGADYVRLNTEISFGLNGVFFYSDNLHIETEVIISNNLNFMYLEGNDKFNLYGRLGLTYKL